MKNSPKDNHIIRWLLLIVLTLSVGCGGSSAQQTIAADIGRQNALMEEYYTESLSRDFTEMVTEEEVMELALSENLIQKLHELSTKTAEENSASKTDTENMFEEIATTEEASNTEEIAATEEAVEETGTMTGSVDTEKSVETEENTKAKKTTDTGTDANADKTTEEVSNQTKESASNSGTQSKSEIKDTASNKETSESKATENNTDTSNTTSKESTSTSVVDSYSFSTQTTQVIDVVTSGSYGTLTLYNKNDNEWTEIFSTSCRVGKNGISSNKKEGDKKTPAGYFTLGQAFGVSSDPGSTRNYLKVTKYHYWVDDSDSSYYNQLVDSSITGIVWDSAEHLIDYPTAYKYAIAINYNTDCTPGNGSAIFLHCSTGNATSGCVSVSESYMVKILKALRSDTIIYIH